MKRVSPLLFRFLLLSFGTLLPQGPARAEARARPQITVRIQNRVHISPESLTKVQKVAFDILHHAGIEVHWLDCGFSGPSPQDPPECWQALGPTDFVLALIEKIQTVAPRLPERTLGFALVPPDGQQGFYAYVSYDHAREVSRQNGAAVEKILGLGAAHELGHLLLGESAHSTIGIMKVAFCDRDLRSALNWNLLFTPRQSKYMRANLARRHTSVHEAPCTQEEKLISACVALNDATRIAGL